MKDRKIGTRLTNFLFAIGGCLVGFSLGQLGTVVGKVMLASGAFIIIISFVRTFRAIKVEREQNK